MPLSYAVYGSISLVIIALVIFLFSKKKDR